MDDRIKVHVLAHKGRRNLTMRYVDPLTIRDRAVHLYRTGFDSGSIYLVPLFPER